MTRSVSELQPRLELALESGGGGGAVLAQDQGGAAAAQQEHQPHVAGEVTVNRCAIDLYSVPVCLQLGLPGNGFYPGVTPPASSGDPDDFLPVDFLEGRMDLAVVLPTKKIVRMAVDRK